jgi:hypothetical protein
MEFKQLQNRPEIEQSKKNKNQFDILEKLINELSKKTIPPEIAESLNKEIDQVNSFSGNNKQLNKTIIKAQSAILQLVEKELKYVPKNHYRNTWMAMGMAVFGLPIGTMFGLSMDNMAFIGIGLPIGLAIGISIGSSKDKKAYEEGKQLDIEI